MDKKHNFEVVCDKINNEKIIKQKDLKVEIYISLKNFLIGNKNESCNKKQFKKIK